MLIGFSIIVVGLAVMAARLFRRRKQEEWSAAAIRNDNLMVGIGSAVVVLGTATIAVFSEGSLHDVGIFLIVAGIMCLIVQHFVDPNGQRPPGDWTSRQYKQRLMVGGFCFIGLGLLILIV